MKRMDVRWQCLIANVSLIAATVSGSASAEPLVVGWVLQGDKGELASPDQISVSRKQPGSALPPNQLAACDRVDLKGGGSFFLLLASGARMRLDSANPSRAVPCNETGVPERLALALRALATEPAPATNQVLTVTRGDQFDIPAIGSRVTKLVEGSRAIFVPWRGGQAPYSISLFREKE